MSMESNQNLTSIDHYMITWTIVLSSLDSRHGRLWNERGRHASGNTMLLNATDAIDEAVVEIATGLSVDDIEILRANASEEARVQIAVKFAKQFDRLSRSKTRKLTGELLALFSKDRVKQVRMWFAAEIKASRHLPPEIAARLARDDIDVAWPILEESPALEDSEIEDIIKTLPEPYSLAIAGRRPLSETLVDLLIEHKGTVRVVVRVIDNDQAALSEQTLGWLQDWGRSNPEIRQHLVRRPNLPFVLIQQHVADLADRLQWKSLETRTMTKAEAARLRNQITGVSRYRPPQREDRFNGTRRELQNRFTAGDLTPSDILQFLKDGDADSIENGLAVLSSLDVRRVRNLLYGSDKRGLIALCLRANFAAAEYLAFRMALGLVELGAATDQPVLTYDETTFKFAKEQFEQMRTKPAEIDIWLQSEWSDRPPKNWKV